MEGPFVESLVVEAPFIEAPVIDAPAMEAAIGLASVIEATVIRRHKPLGLQPPVNDFPVVQASIIEAPLIEDSRKLDTQQLNESSTYTVALWKPTYRLCQRTSTRLTIH